MFNKGISFDEGERKKLLDSVKSFELPETRFSFINDHKGLRLGKRHVLLGTTGTGKSTLTRSLVLDLAQKTKVVLYSTEETLEDTKTMFAMRNVPDEILKNIEFVFEGDLQQKIKASGQPDELAEWERLMAVKMMNAKSQVLFFDNITTSAFYDGVKYENSIAFLDTINSLITDMNCAFFVVAHTKKGIKDDQQGLIAADDIKGPTSLIMKAEYLYIYQRLITQTASGADCSNGIIRVKKARSTGDTDSVYLLNYEWDRKEYFGDIKVSFSKFSELYSERVKLGVKKK